MQLWKFRQRHWQSGGPTATSSASAPGSANAGGSFGLTVGVLHAFTGQNAFFGLNAQNSCKAAALNINAAGGILGHSLTCTDFDTKGDPADAVPVTNRMLVSASHLVMVLGPDGSDIPSVLPVLEQAKVPEMNTVGDPRYDTQTSQDFWRLTPSDSTQAPALAYYTHQRGFTKIAEVFTSDLSASTTTQPFQASYTKLGGTIVKAVTITPDASSYQTEVAAVLAAHPQAIVGEMDSQTAATFLSELRQQNGSMLPVIMTQRAIQGDWEPSVGPAIGVASIGQYVTAIAPALQSSGAAFTGFTSALTAIKANPFQAKNPFVAASYDGVTAFALAMDSGQVGRPDRLHRIHPEGHHAGRRRRRGLHLRPGRRGAEGRQDHRLRRRRRRDGLQPEQHGEPAVRAVDLQRRQAQLDHGHDLPANAGM